MKHILNKQLISSVLIFMGILYYCAVRTDEIVGKWQTFAVYENGREMKIPVELVQLEFSRRTYTFCNNLNFREKGRWRRDGEWLFTHDHLHKDSEEKVVRIQYLSSDSLYLEMENEGGNAQLMQLVRIKNELASR